MGNGPRLVCLEAPDYLPAEPNYVNVAIVGAEEEAIGAGADAGDVIALEEGAGLVVGDLDLGGIKEVKRPPRQRHGRIFIR